MDTSKRARMVAATRSRLHTHRRALRSRVAMALVFALGLSAATATTTLAAGSIGPFKFSGQLSGTVSEGLNISERLDGSTLPAVGCQVQQSSTPEDLIHFATLAPKIKDDGKALGDLDITTEAMKDGDNETLAPDQAQVVVTVSIGTKNSEWMSTSGKLEVKDKGLAGSFNAVLVPAGKAPGGSPIQSGGATNDIHVSGSWSTCRQVVGG